MVGKVCASINNFFTVTADIKCGRYTVENGVISLPYILPGQYFRIVGSIFNDGVYQMPDTGNTVENLKDEVFDGAIWAMRVPPAFIAICAKIEEYSNSEAAAPSGYKSESFGGYSYTKGEISENSWQSVFAAELNRWRKL